MTPTNRAAHVERERGKKMTEKKKKPSHNGTKDDFIGDLQTLKISPTLLPVIIETSVFTSH